MPRGRNIDRYDQMLLRNSPCCVQPIDWIEWTMGVAVLESANELRRGRETSLSGDWKVHAAVHVFDCVG